MSVLFLILALVFGLVTAGVSRGAKVARSTLSWREPGGLPFCVIPAKAGIQLLGCFGHLPGTFSRREAWIPAFAGMTIWGKTPHLTD
jgi:hypothetical protein